MPLACSVRRSLLGAAVLSAALFAVGCSSTPPPPKPTVVTATIAAGADINPDAGGRPSPLVIRIYELKALSAFNEADFFSLWDRDQQTLGADLLAREEMVLRPGDRNTLTRTAKPDTRFIGVVAAFRDLERASWRGSAVVLPAQTQPLTIRVDARSVGLSAGK